MKTFQSAGEYYGLLKYVIRHVRPTDLKDSSFITYAVNFSRWKRPLLEKMFPDRRFLFVPRTRHEGFFRQLQRVVPAQSIFVWGMDPFPDVDALAAANDIEVIRLEDGFIRSVGLGSRRIPPLSLCLDAKSLYYDYRSPSQLDDILATHDFDADTALMQEARSCLDFVRRHEISKYNLPSHPHPGCGYDNKQRHVLCIGQVEDDASILCGCDRPLSNNELIRMAAAENPDAKIIYKIHPDYVAGKRQPLTDFAEVADLCTVVGDEAPLQRLFEVVERVYTITSLGGFEALIRGVPVTTLGMPFYAGWGLTDDRQAIPAWRGRRLSVEQVFAAAYILYPHYFEPHTMRRSDLRGTIQHIVETTRQAADA